MDDHLSFVFVGGMGRSGTSLLQKLLNSHSKVVAGPEFDPLHSILEAYRLTVHKVETKRISTYVDRGAVRTSFATLISRLFSRTRRDMRNRFSSKRR